MRMHPALPPEDSGDSAGAGRSPNCSRTPDQRDVGFARMKQRVAGSASITTQAMRPVQTLPIAAPSRPRSGSPGAWGARGAREVPLRPWSCRVPSA